MSDPIEQPWTQPHALSVEAQCVKVMAEARAEFAPTPEQREFARRVVALIDAHANDLADMLRICENVSDVYCHIAGLSKPLTDPMYIKQAHDEAVDASYEEGKADAALVLDDHQVREHLMGLDALSVHKDTPRVIGGQIAALAADLRHDLAGCTALQATPLTWREQPTAEGPYWVRRTGLPEHAWMEVVGRGFDDELVTHDAHGFPDPVANYQDGWEWFGPLKAPP